MHGNDTNKSVNLVIKILLVFVEILKVIFNTRLSNFVKSIAIKPFKQENKSDEILHTRFKKAAFSIHWFKT